jgi:hypothetical protein
MESMNASQRIAAKLGKKNYYKWNADSIAALRSSVSPHWSPPPRSAKTGLSRPGRTWTACSRTRRGDLNTSDASPRRTPSFSYPFENASVAAKRRAADVARLPVLTLTTPFGPVVGAYARLVVAH